tara:strand:+ start:157 stop:870 length:714 start_codon:yes stop_codon:yes gene_type:complete
LLENKIEFISPLKGFIPEPKPASFYIPKEYKNLSSYVTESYQNPTVKKCIPFLDTYMTGYIIPFPVDIEFIAPSKSGEGAFVINNEIPNELLEYLVVSGHQLAQISSNLRNPKRTIDNIFKFTNPWIIKTPPGYSCYFLTPPNHVLPFDLISGIVETDTYSLRINFPFYWIGSIKNQILKQGSPMAIVIPFKREAWKMKTSYRDTSTMHYKKMKLFDVGSKIKDNYKTKFWKKKSFK